MHHCHIWNILYISDTFRQYTTECSFIAASTSAGVAAAAGVPVHGPLPSRQRPYTDSRVGQTLHLHFRLTHAPDVAPDSTDHILNGT